MAEYEEGELSDSDEDFKKANNCRPDLSYRTDHCLINSSDSESDSSDDECDFKRKKNVHQNKVSCPPPIVSSAFAKAAEAFQTFQKKKVNNIWSSVLEEQNLTQDLSRFDVQSESLLTDERGVESYHYWLKRGETNEGASENNNFQRRGRKRNIKDRLGRRTYDKNKIRDIDVTESDSIEKVVAEITAKLKETNQELIERVVQTLGTKKALELYYITEDIEDAGGMMTLDGSRRRTPGGVFFQIVKSDPHIHRRQINLIFFNNMIANYKLRPKKKLSKKKQRHRKRKHKVVTNENAIVSQETKEHDENMTDIQNVENCEDLKMCE